MTTRSVAERLMAAGYLLCDRLRPVYSRPAGRCSTPTETLFRSPVAVVTAALYRAVGWLLIRLCCLLDRLRRKR